jgi:Fic family protein
MKQIEKAPDTANYFNDNPGRLEELLNSKELEAALYKVNEEYLYWDKVKYLTHYAGIEPIDIWAATKLRRKSSSYNVQFGKYAFFWNQNKSIQKYLHQFDLNIGGSLESGSPIRKDEKSRYLLSSIMEEAIASSQIEGAVTTRKAAKDMLRKNRTPRDTSEQMILNNFITIQKVVSLKDEDLTIERLLELHRTMTSHTLGNHADEGAFRTRDDIHVVDAIDGEIVHKPPSHTELPQLMDELIAFFNTNEDVNFIHPVIKGIIVHFMIGFIHPFSDGNGRTARTLFYLYLLKKGYWLTEYLSISRLILRSKTQYAKAFQYTEIDDNDLTYFITYKLRTMELAFDALKEYLQRKIQEKKQLADLIAIGGINDRQALILKWFNEEGELYLTVKETEQRLGVSNQTARTDLLKLAERNLLKILPLNKKTEAFIKGDEFDNLLGDK